MGIDCPSAVACVAVGSYASGDTAAPLVERWNGSTWGVQAAPIPTGALFAELSAVDCVSATWCVAVGSYFTTNYVSRSFALRWDGTAWMQVASPNPAGFTNADFAGVSCFSTTFCIAVGEWANDLANFTLVETFNGTGWTIRSSPTPSGSFAAVLSSVVCVSASSCLAVGSADTGTGPKAISQRWNGTSVAGIAVAKPAAAATWQLQSVSCASATYCFATGGQADLTGKSSTVTQRWNGTAWATIASPNRTYANDSRLAGVRCASTTSCIAVGVSGGTLIETWNGTAWAITTAQVGGARRAFAAVKCLTATSCFAVGSAVTPAGPVTFIQSWNGTAWSTMTSPTPAGTVAVDLTGISCTSASFCVAVGTQSNGTTQTPLALRWNGTAWSLMALATPVDAFDTTLRAVSCTGTANCFAVGSSSNFDGTTTLVQKWNGTAWSIMTSPTPAGTTGVDLLAVSCSTASACFAVGSQSNSTGYLRTLTLRWNGSLWTTVTSPNPTGTVDAHLNSVSCVSTNTCVAVGSYEPGLGEKTTAMRWTGSSWILTPTPNPVGAFASSFRSISCTSTTACTTVGFGYDGSQSKPVAAQWNGTAWTLQTPIHPAGSPDAVLSGVSCTGAAACLAAGSNDISSGRFTLAERYQ